ncbi:MAG: trypsin-like peptidase domain-containing protein [Lachnospiraceae bacterium]|nr:trypsin-like peptidase domain-containing protein [Lachnospiraceae bacterium]
MVSFMDDAFSKAESLEEVNDNISDSSDTVIQTASVVNNNTPAGSLDVSAIAENVMPSIVAINVKAIQEVNQGIFGSYQYEAEGAGSGIIIGENESELLIVTNNHVVASAETVSVEFADGESYDAKVKSVDSSYDLAIVVVPLDEISEDTKSAIKVANIGSSDDLKVGEQVVAIGNALGYGQSVTTGIVSAKERTTDTNDLPLIQTDAAINPGNSGGALLNINGEVVGINSSKYASTEVEGMGYAIPISEVNEIIDNLSSKRTREKVDEKEQGSLGIKCGTVTSEASQMYGIPVGVLVSEVVDGSAAEKAGIKKNYVITKFDGQSVSSAEGLVEMLKYYRAGEKVEITVKYMKDNEYVEDTIIVKLDKKN